MKQAVLIDFAKPLLLLTAATLLFRFTDLDLKIAGSFFSPQHGWSLRFENPWLFIYNFASLPALALGALALLGLAGSFFSRRIVRYRKISLFLLLLLALGPGLVVNVIFKDHWGRPRPNEIVQFNGKQQFLPVWQKGTPTPNSSFPSGHASVGFFLMAPYFILRPHSKGASRLFLGLGLASGSLVGLARIVQGGHFASDVLWSGGFVYLVGLSLYFLMGLHRTIWYTPAKNSNGDARQNEIFQGGALFIIVASVLSYFYLDRPLAEFFYAHHAALSPLFSLITFFGRSELYLIPALLLFLLWRRTNTAAAEKSLYLFTVVAVSGITVDIIKVIVARYRPDLFFTKGWYGFDFFRIKSDFLSFPSGHTATALGAAVAIGLIYPRLRYPLLAAASIIAASRIILTSHFLSDVYVGAYIGILTAILIHRWYFRQRISQAAILSSKTTP